MVIHLISEHHKIELHLFFSRFDASKHRAELQPKCIQSTAPSAFKRADFLDCSN